MDIVELSQRLEVAGYIPTGLIWPGYESTAVELVYSSTVVDEAGQVWKGDAPIEDYIRELLFWVLKVADQTQPSIPTSPLVRQLIDQGYELQEESSGLLAGCGQDLESGRAVWDEFGRMWLHEHPDPEEGFPDGVQVIK